MSFVYATSQTTTDIPTKTGNFPAKQMKMQKEKIAKLVSLEISQTLPQVIDKYTTLSTVKVKGSTLVYTFHINTGSKSDATIQKEDRSRMKKAVTIGVCLSSKKFLAAGINTSYIYKSAKSEMELFKFDISQNDCVGLIK
jgi:hypothetical protein